MRARGVAAVIGCLALAACGTTVPTNQQAALTPAGGGTSSPGLQQPADGLGAVGGTVPGAGRLSVGGQALGSHTEATGQRESGRGPGGLRTSATKINGPGVTASEIRVGLIYPKNGTAAESLGVQGVTVGDMKADQEAIVADLNRHGGIAGRRVVPVFYGIDSASAQTAAQVFQAQCSYFTEDHPVFAVIPSGYDDGLVACLTKAKTAVLQVNPSGAGNAVYHRYPAYTEPAGINLDRTASLLVPSLQRQRYFSPWDASAAGPGVGPVRVGVVTFDTPTARHATDQVLVPALKGAGYPVEVARVRYPQTNAEVGNMGADIQAAILRFRQLGVAHVLIQDQGGLVSLLFVRDAESQHFYPRYGVTTNNTFQLLLGGGNITPKSATGALGLGWSPISDLAYGENPASSRWSNPARQHCAAVMRTAGLTFTDSGSEGTALSLCDGLYGLRAALGSTESVNQSAFVSGINALGRSFQGASSIASRFAADQHDAVAATYDYGYVQECSCMRYTGPIRAAGPSR